MEQKRTSLLRNTIAGWFSAGLICLAVIVSFGISISRLGLYGDQWRMVLYPSSAAEGSASGQQIQSLLIILFGTQAIYYHLSNLALFILDGILLYKILNRLGIAGRYSLGSALLFLVSPAFSQPAAAFELSTILIGLLFSFLSLDCYISSLQKGRSGLIQLAIGIIFACLAFASSIYIVAFEGMIVFAILILVKYYQKNFKVWILLGLAGHFLCSIAILGKGFSSDIRHDPSLLLISTKNWIDGFILSWRQIIAMPQGGRQVGIYLLILGAAVYVIVFFLQFMENNEIRVDLDNSKISKKDIEILLGSAFMGMAYLLVLHAFQIPIEMKYPLDNGMVIVGLLAAVFVVFMIKILFIKEYQMVILAMLIVLSAGARYQTTQQYVLETKKVENFISQLHVRGDSIRDGTSIVTEQLPFDFTTRGALEALIQKSFSLPQTASSIQIIPADLKEVREYLSNLDIDITGIRIDGNTYQISKDKILVVWMPGKACVQVLEPTLDYENLPQGLALSKDLSNPSLIDVTNMSDVKQLDEFRTTINDDWCFAYQLANRQIRSSQWDAVIQTYDRAKEQLLHSERYQEYVPLLSAFLLKQNYTEAGDLSKLLINEPASKDSICRQWTNILTSETLEEEVAQKARTTQISVGCN